MIFIQFEKIKCAKSREKVKITNWCWINYKYKEKNHDQSDLHTIFFLILLFDLVEYYYHQD